MHGRPEKRKSPRRRLADAGSNRITLSPLSTDPARTGQNPWKKISTAAIVDALRDNATPPIRVRLTALQASNGDLPYDTERALRCLYAQRHRQLETAARLYRGGPR